MKGPRFTPRFFAVYHFVGGIFTSIIGVVFIIVGLLKSGQGGN